MRPDVYEDPAVLELVYAARNAAELLRLHGSLMASDWLERAVLGVPIEEDAE